MNKLYLRLIFIKNNKTLEVIFDSRLSFKENFSLLNNIEKTIDFREFYIFDRNINAFLDKDIPINLFNMNNLTTLTVF